MWRTPVTPPVGVETRERSMRHRGQDSGSLGLGSERGGAEETRQGQRRSTLGLGGCCLVETHGNIHGLHSSDLWTFMYINASIKNFFKEKVVLGRKENLICQVSACDPGGTLYSPPSHPSF